MQTDFTLRFQRIHVTGTEARLSQHAEGWRVQVNLREPNHSPMTITCYLAPTLKLARETADKEISKDGHICNEACKEWAEIPRIDVASLDA